MSNLPQPEMIKMISIIYRKSQIYLNEQLEDLDLTSGLSPFIIIICKNGKMVQNRFCELLNMSKSSVAKMLAKLEKQGYVLRHENEEDGRSIDVYPTEKAQKVYPYLVKIGEDWAVKATNGMTDIERSIFSQMLQKVVDNISCSISPFTS